MPSLDIYHYVTNLPKTWQLKTTNIYYLIQILGVKSLAAALETVYGSEALMRLQSRSRTELQSAEAVWCPLPNSLMRLSPGASVPYYVSLSTGLLNNTWILQSKWSKTQRDQDGSCSIFYNLILKVPYHHFCYIYWSHKPTLAQCGKEVDKVMNLRSRGSIGLSWRLTTQFWVFSFSSLSACSCFKLLPYSLTTKSKIPGFVSLTQWMWVWVNSRS